LSNFSKIIIAVFALLLLVSCKTSDTRYSLPTFVRKYPKNKPFVYKTNIKLIGNLSKEQKTILTSKLSRQLEDSVNPKPKQKLIWQTIRKPAVYDTFYVNQSIRFMRALLHTSGYFSDSVTYDTLLRIKGDQYRTIINFNVKPGPVTILDSVWYNLELPELQKIAVDTAKEFKKDSATAGISQPLQRLTDSTGGQSLLHKGSTFSQDTIAQDLDRLVTLFRNNGYFRFTREGLIGVWDTLDVSLLKPTIDLQEQMELLAKLAYRREHPTATLEVRLKPGYDSANLVKYYVGKIFIIPDFGPDTTVKRDTVQLDKSFFVAYSNYLFRPKIFPQYVYMERGDVYSQNNYLKTVSMFNTLISWRLVSVIPQPRPGTDTVDFEIRLIPARKYLAAASLEGSKNTNTYNQGNLFGIGVNFSLQNRNFAKSADQENIAIRYGTELDIGALNHLVNARQIGLGYNIFFPRFVPRPSWLGKKWKSRLKEATTVLAFNLALTQRTRLYNLSTFNTSYAWLVPYRSWLFAFKFPNIEYSLLDAKDSLQDIFKINPGLRNVFNDGLIISSILSVTKNFIRNRRIITGKLNWEESGLLTFAVMKNNEFIRKNLYRYVKPDLELKLSYKPKFRNSEFVTRFFVGVGIPFEFIDDTGGVRSRYLPFYKAYGAGGPNSMRGWRLRRLGPGSTVKFIAEFPDRFGDIQFETNLEYRYFLANLFGFNVHSALFADIGNVWFLRDNPTFPDGNFRFSHFLRDLAVDVGTGIRVDLGFFLIRLDYALMARDPAPEPDDFEFQYKWFPKWRGNLQFAVTYPF